MTMARLRAGPMMNAVHPMMMAIEIRPVTMVMKLNPK
jgi:hypothetical protein